MAPIQQHRSFRYLVRHFVDSHPALRGADAKAVVGLLAPAIAVAYWITRYAPALAGTEHLTIAVAAKSLNEVADEGRWYQFIPWLLGSPNMNVAVTLMVSDPSSMNLGGLARTRLHHYVRQLKPAAIQLDSIGAVRDPDSYSLFVLSHPNFANGHEFWFGSRELQAITKSNKPLAVFAYSSVEHEFDRAAANAYGVNAARGIANPFNAEPEGWRGNYAGWMWDMTGCCVPPNTKPDASVLEDIDMLEDLLAGAVEEFGDVAISSLGDAIQPKGVCRAPEAAKAIVLLLPSYALDLNDGEVYSWSGAANTVYRLQPVVKVPMALCDAFPGNEDLFRRWAWVARVFKQHVLDRQDHGVSRMTPRQEQDVVRAMVDEGMSPEAAQRMAMAFIDARLDVAPDVKRIHNLLKDGESAQVLELLQGQASLASSIGENGDTLVLAAVAHNDLQVVAKCIELQADVKAAGFDGFAPIHLAAREGYAEIARMLLEAGADPAASTPLGWTAAAMAKHNGHAEVFKLLARSTAQAGRP